MEHCQRQRLTMRPYEWSRAKAGTFAGWNIRRRKEEDGFFRVENIESGAQAFRYCFDMACIRTS
jgi:hypothetical protein